MEIVQHYIQNGSDGFAMRITGKTVNYTEQEIDAWK